MNKQIIFFDGDGTLWYPRSKELAIAAMKTVIGEIQALDLSE